MVPPHKRAEDGTRRKAVKLFTTFVQRPRELHHELQPSAQSDGSFAILPDDAIIYLAMNLLKLGPKEERVAYFKDVESSRHTFLIFLTLCRRIASTIYRLRPQLLVEALARACTRVEPVARQLEDAMLFTKHMFGEMRSYNQLKMLEFSITSMALHCARECCEYYRIAFNKDLRKKRVIPPSPYVKLDESRLISVLQNCSLVACQPDGEFAFAYARETQCRGQGSERTRRYKDIIIRMTARDQNTKGMVEFARTETVELNLQGISSPVTMRASPDGQAVVYVSLKYDDYAGNAALSTAFLWCATWSSVVKVRSALFQQAACYSVQDAWFRRTNGETTLLVAWSTRFVRPGGEVLDTNGHTPCYYFSSYNLNVDEKKLDMFVETYGCHGTLMSCSPSEDGNKVATLIQRRKLGITLQNFRVVYIEDIEKRICVEVPTTSLNSGPEGPFAASLSPSADLIATLGLASGSIYATMSWNCAGTYQPIKTINLSPCMKTWQFGVLPTFSPCGRYVAFVDQSAMFGDVLIDHCAVVVVDFALRELSVRTRIYSLFTCEQQAPRALHWTRTGIWLLAPGVDEQQCVGPRGGAVCLYSGSGMCHNE